MSRLDAGYETAEGTHHIIDTVGDRLTVHEPESEETYVELETLLGLGYSPHADVAWSLFFERDVGLADLEVC